jgi:hypothetical protein
MAGIETMFSRKLVAAVTSLLKQRCQEGGVCKRDEIHALLAEKFGLPGGEYQDAVIRAAVEGGVFNHGGTQYANFKGGRGACATGVREVDVEALRHAEEVAEKRRANVAKARAARAEKTAERKARAAETKAKRQENAAKARAARLVKKEAETSETMPTETPAPAETVAA